MELTKDCKKVLKILNKLRLKGNITPNKYDLVNALSIKKFAKMPLMEIIKELQKNEYLSYAGTADNYTVQLEYKGITYAEQQKKRRKEFLINSILVPILVSALASCLTTYFAFKITLWLNAEENVQATMTQSQTP